MPAPPAPTSRSGASLIALAAVLWGTSGVVAGGLLHSTSLTPVSIAAFRLAIAAVVLIIASIRSLPAFWNAMRRHPVVLVLSGVLLAAYQGLYYVAVQLCGVSISTLVSLGIAPVLVVSWESLRRRALPSPRMLVLLTVAIAGLACVALGGSTAPVAPTAIGGGANAIAVGVLLSVASGAVYAAGTIVSARAAEEVSTTAVTTLSIVIAAACLVPFSLADIATTVRTTDDLASLSTILWLLYLGVATNAASYWLFYRGLRSTPIGVASLLTLLEPVAATALAITILGDPLTLTVAIGGIAMLSAIAVLSLSPRTPRVLVESPPR